MATEVTCDRCGTVLEIGMHPFCRGKAEDHGVSVMVKGAGFPFETKHINGKPMVIESLHHLRSVEKQYGVVLTAFSNNRSNWNDNIRGDLPRFRGNDLEYRD